ncbi:MAG: CBS domain-containing protein [Gammaproteobacteria bacterium]|nr:CBS domain-containing protein [Gammaproteobacteria bacterium]
MGGALATVPEDEGIWETLEKMRELGVRRMPVVDAAGALEGSSPWTTCSNCSPRPWST